MKATLNVLYLRGTARALSLGALSLARYSPFHLRLVSNGCSDEEERFLARLCDAHPKLCFLSLPLEAILDAGNGSESDRSPSRDGSPAPGAAKHSEALNHLQAIEASPFFGFVDSDIFAVGEFGMDFHPGRPAIFTAMPLTTASTRRHERFQAAKNQVGSSFLAIYQNDVLTKMRHETGLGFELYRWKRIPAALQQRLESAGRAREKFDTGKLLNTLLVLEGQSIVWLEDRNLWHLGGYSHPTPPIAAPASPAKLPGYLVRKWRRHVTDYRRAGTLLERKRFYRAACAQHFRQLFEALDRGEPPPDIPRLRDAYVRQKLERTCEDLQKLHDQLGGVV